MILRLNKTLVPDGSLIGVFGDVHIPHHDEVALSLAVDACERAGATHIVLNGDVVDCGPVSRHASKRAKAVLDEGSLLDSMSSGRWFLDWANTRPCWYTRGNHEAWLEEQIASDPALKGATTPETLMRIPSGIVNLPSLSKLRLGSLVIEHGDGFFPRGNGGANPALRIATVAPDQSTIVNHLHRRFFRCWTTEDERGIPKTRAVFGNPHMSKDDAHGDYAGTYHGWQQGFLLVRVYWEGDRPRFTVYPVDIHRNKRNRPTFELFGTVYK